MKIWALYFDVAMLLWSTFFAVIDFNKGNYPFFIIMVVLSVLWVGLLVRDVKRYKRLNGIN